MGLKFENRSSSLKCCLIYQTKETLFVLDYVHNARFRLSIIIKKGWRALSRFYHKTDLRSQKIEELLEILKW